MAIVMILSLVTDLLYARGWEHSCAIVLVLAGDDGYVDNICMRAVANMSLIKLKETISIRKIIKKRQ